jgi:DNA-binding response OmpR family regulator
VASMARTAVRGPRALVILNICRDPLIRQARAKTLNDAGYYTSAAESPEEAISQASAVYCAIAIVCDSLSEAERRSIQLWMQEHAPTTTVIILGKSVEADPELLLSSIRTAVASRDSWNTPGATLYPG